MVCEEIAAVGLTRLSRPFSSNTPRKAVFAGSMQLLAGVKLCTGRTLTNHPHYEDNSLRERTKAVRGAWGGAGVPAPGSSAAQAGLKPLASPESRPCPAHSPYRRPETSSCSEG